MTPDIHRIKIRIELKVLDWAAVRQHARDVIGNAENDVPLTDGDAIRHAVLNPSRGPLDCGYELLAGTQGHRLSNTSAAVDLEMRVIDRSAFVAEARRCYRQCWFDQAWRPSSLGEAAYEVLWASNANPSPVDIGLETTNFIPLENAPAPAEAAADAV